MARTNEATHPPAGAGPAWHAMAADEALTTLGSGREGLSSRRAGELLDRNGPNRQHPRKQESWLEEFLESFTEPLQLLLIVVAVLSFVFGELMDALAILGVIVLSAAVETTSEVRASRAITALEDLSAPHARVLRDGTRVSVDAAAVVPGDVLVLEAGDIIAADARILDAHGLRVDESMLTGEAVSAGKSTTAVAEGADLASRSSLVFAGTHVMDGQGTAVAVSTGPGTELGRIGTAATTQAEQRTPLQQAMKELARLVLILAVLVSVAVPLLGIFVAGQRPQDMLLTALTMVFATVPEELPILVTVLLAVGGLQLARRGALLRRLAAGEALGSITHLLTDKTGTLTQNRLVLHEVRGTRERVLSVALAAQGGPSAGSKEPMEQAIAAAAAKELPLRDLQTLMTGPVLGVWPFDPDRQRVARAWQDGSGAWLAVGGAPEAVLAAARAGQAGDWSAQAASLAAQGRRVIAFASRPLSDRETLMLADAGPDGGPVAAELERDLSVAGLVVFDDPLREGVREAVAELHGAGVATLVVTGDHPDTGRAVASAAGLAAGPTLRGGAALASMDDDELAGRLVDGTVVGRATPSDKLRLVRLLQSRGHRVAVTGDGVNDAPALAAADVGIAMGLRGTDLARQAAGLVLTDDAYPTVVRAVEKGRSVASQLRRAVAFYLGAKVALVAAMTAALLAGHPVPFAPAHIVLLELFMDIGASLAFVSEPVAPAAMCRPPRPAGARFVDRDFLTALSAVGLTLALAVIPAYLILSATGADTGQARAGAVFAWLAGHVLIAWTLRARPGLSWRANPAFPAWAAAATGSGLAAVTWPPAAAALRLTPLTGQQLAVTVAAVAAATALAVLLRRFGASTARL
ncbi:cation-translocating P-type ATPase [Arthrobacter sp. CG_A4]|uniref:cation-translocating P-type ATPase n=1 Tax=Arthrobacter sp. CG_A4 TaxID=3071706 RepID=UPI002E0311B6|nr:Ca2+-transporting ATPase [Arthrobacter sp. CG_A4]